jgi:hypothetical protein
MAGFFKLVPRVRRKAMKGNSIGSMLRTIMLLDKCERRLFGTSSGTRWLEISLCLSRRPDRKFSFHDNSLTCNSPFNFEWIIEFSEFTHNAKVRHIPREPIRSRRSNGNHQMLVDQGFNWTESPPMHGGDMRILAQNRYFTLFQPESSDVQRVRTSRSNRSTT